MEYIIGSVVVIAVVILMIIRSSRYAKLVKLHGQVEHAVGALAAQLRQRRDLIPDALTAARESVSTQVRYLESILDSRHALALEARATGEADESVPIELRPLITASRDSANARTVHEDNPQFDPKVYERLQEIMLATEKDVAAARRFLQAATSDYNTALRTYMGSLVGGKWGFELLPTDRIDRALAEKPDYWSANAWARDRERVFVPPARRPTSLEIS